MGMGCGGWRWGWGGNSISTWSIAGLSIDPSNKFSGFVVYTRPGSLNSGVPLLQSLLLRPAPISAPTHLLRRPRPTLGGPPPPGPWRALPRRCSERRPTNGQGEGENGCWASILARHMPKQMCTRASSPGDTEGVRLGVVFRG